MNKTKSSLFIFFVVCLTAIRAQKIQISAFDSVQKTPLLDVKAISKKGVLLAASKNSGKILFDKSLVQTGITLYKEGYRPKEISLFDIKSSDSLVVFLDLNVNKLDTANIRIQRKDFIFSTNQIIEDYIVKDKDHILLIVSGKNQGHFNLHLINFNGDVLHKVEFYSEPSREFFKDCNNNYHLVLKDSAYQISFFDSTVSLVFKVPLKTLFDLLYPCKIMLGNKAIVEIKGQEKKVEGMYFDNRAPALYTDYFLYSNSKKTFFKRIYLNQNITKMYREELNYEKSWKGIKSDQAIESQRSFYYSKIYKSPHLYFFKNSDSTFVTYDLEVDSLSYFNIKTGASNNIKLAPLYQKSDFNICQDDKTRNVYFNKRHSNLIYHHDLATNTFTRIRSTLTINARLICIYDNTLFYVEKPAGATDKIFLRCFPIKL